MSAINRKSTDGGFIRGAGIAQLFEKMESLKTSLNVIVSLDQC